MKIRGATIMVAGGLLALVGCGTPEEATSSTAEAETQTDGSSTTGADAPASTGGVFDSWFETTSGSDGQEPGSTTAPGTTAGPASITDTMPDSGEEEESAGEPDEVGWGGWGMAMPGVSFEGYDGELFIFVEGEELCYVSWQYAPGATPNDTCAQCDFAFDITRENIVVELDEGCADYVDTSAIPTMLSIGYADRTLYLLEDGAWEEVGEAEYLPDDEQEFGWWVDL